MEVSASLAALKQWGSDRFLPTMDALFAFLSEDPVLRSLQFALLTGAALLVFTVFYTTRDILHRTRSLFRQVTSILLVAALPFVGFLLYFLVRPRLTLEEREMQDTLLRILEHVEKGQKSAGARSFSPSIALRAPMSARAPLFAHRPLKKKEEQKPAFASA